MRSGFVQEIERAGGSVLTSTCPLVSQTVPDVPALVFDSVKQARYVTSCTRSKVFVGPTERCLEAAVSGVWTNSVPGWGDVFDLETGSICEVDNPARGMSIKGKVLILNGSRGSTGFATQFHRVRVADVGPSALVFPRTDSRLGATCAVLRVPAVTDLEEDIFRLVRSGDRVTVDGDRGIVEIFKT